MSDGTGHGVGAIRTPDQRLRVFVSSTLGELADERAAVSRAITALHLTPVMFELGARPHPPQELYRAYLAQSDIFIGLYWQRYGWVGPGMDISGLEDEFRLSTSIPRLLYVKAPAPERDAGLTAMLDAIKAKGTEAYRTFRSTRELGRLVREDLALLLSERFAGGADGAVAAAQIPTTPRRARSIPQTSTTLIGRDEEIAAILALLDAPAHRLVTLTGPGGVGKTRLAIAVADRLDGRYAQGAIYLPLGTIARPELVMPRIAEAVGATLGGASAPLDVVAEHLGETPTLLVLDELEQVVSVAPELDALLARCPGLRILATSRSVLRIRAERECPVTPLTIPAWDEAPALQQVASLPAIRLFVDRAQAVRYDFALTDDNATAVAEICRRLDGLPLAIELAAARTRLLEPAALLERLGRSLDVLGTGPVDLPERQRTLRATVEWSIGLLDPDEQDMLWSLSAFVGGWTIEAAVHVSGIREDRALDLIDSLAGHSLVTVDRTDRGPRSRLLATIRQIAAERLATRDDRDDIARRHAAFFRELVAGTDWPTEHQAAWAERLRVEEGNLAVAIRWHLDHDIAPLPHMFRILWLFWQMRDRMPEGRAWIRELVQQAERLDVRARAELMFVSAITASEVGDDADALAADEVIQRVQGQLHDPYLESATSLARSWVLPIVDDIEGALQAAETAAEGFRRLGDPLLGWATLTVGLYQLALGRPEDAEASHTEAEELGVRFGNRWLQTAAMTQLASIAVIDGRLDEARASLEEVVRPHEGVELSNQGLTFALVSRARLALAEDDVRSAAIAVGAAEALRRRIGLGTWPSMRRSDKELSDRIVERVGPKGLAAALAAGAELSRADALALVRGSGDDTSLT
jgi:predicted ATPase